MVERGELQWQARWFWGLKGNQGRSKNALGWSLKWAWEKKSREGQGKLLELQWQAFAGRGEA